MKKNKKWIQYAILILFVVIAGVTLFSSVLSNEDIPEVGKIAPDFTLGGLDGQVYRLSDFAGQPVIVNFWGTFCEPCVREMPAIEDIYKKYQSKDVVVLGVNLNGEPEVTVRSFVNQVGVTFPILLDNRVVSEQYDVKYYPTTFFIDSKGKIIEKKIGEMNESYLIQTVNKLLAEKE
ncbi:redoxin domain-containing protein [Chengkuizengella axinellae]|uniref:Redoxin domain-containing protein n=1 Tax=Chengkuizengella axinellae TaxID=3064388 RepID=A0ABT9IWL6_9BACL|nr:redoxin domain-containing protein [Chengkuizengella sp. 2205SS18-9]MDP5273761.1 redoxin domain-containing protein [Chengkuizengella sp. 2205SS18-9]